MQTEPQAEHKWLERLLGEWTYETQCGEGEENWSGTESVRAIGGLWVLNEGRGPMPGGGEALMLVTLGFDPAKGKYVGTWVGSMMANLWVYEGEVDASGNKLTLAAEGPAFHDPAKTALYHDTIEFLGDDVRTLTSSVQQDDGSWHTFMTTTAKRVA